MVNSVKHFISILSLMAFLFFVLSKAGQLARPMDGDSDVWADYYAEADNTIDTVMIGSSAMYRYWIPVQAFSEQNFTSALIASAGQDIRLAPYIMEEAVKSQNVDLFVVELRSAVFRGNIDQINKDNLNYNLEVLVTGMNPSFTKYEMIQKYYQEDEVQKIKLMFPILMYHDNLVQYDSELIIDRMNTAADEYKFARQVSKITPLKKPVLKASDEKYMSDEALGYIDDIQKKADELGIRVLFLSTQYALTAKQGAIQLELDSYLEGKGYDYLDLNLYIEDMELDYSTDFYNKRHTNISGAKKVTSYLAKYIKDNYDLSAELNEEQKQSWTDAESEWSSEEEELLNEWTKYQEKGK